MVRKFPSSPLHCTEMMFYCIVKMYISNENGLIKVKIIQHLESREPSKVAENDDSQTF